MHLIKRKRRQFIILTLSFVCCTFYNIFISLRKEVIDGLILTSASSSGQWNLLLILFYPRTTVFGGGDYYSILFWLLNAVALSAAVFLVNCWMGTKRHPSINDSVAVGREIIKFQRFAAFIQNPGAASSSSSPSQPSIISCGTSLLVSVSTLKNYIFHTIYNLFIKCRNRSFS